MFHKHNYIIYSIITGSTFLLSFLGSNYVCAQRPLQIKNSETLKQDQKSSSDEDPTKELFFSGINEYLDRYGIQLGLNWVTENAGVVRGGKRKGFDFTQQISFSVDMDWEKLVGWKGFSTHAIIMNRSGRNASADYVGDSQIQAQEVYGGGYARLLHMYDLYAQQKLWHDKIDIKIGRMSVGDDYAHSAIACQFMLLATCGHPRSAQSQQGFSDWPGAVWGGRILYKITPKSYIQVGAYQSTPWPQGGRTGWDWGAASTTGAFVPVELGYNPDIGKDHLIGHIHVGVGLDSSRFETWSSQVSGSGKKDNRFQFWIQADQMVYRNDPVEDHGLYVIANYGHDAATTSTFKDFYNIGLLDRGFWKARSYDQFGLMLTYYTVPRGLSRAQEYQINHGMVTGANGIFNGLLNGAPGIQTNSLLIEANYGIAAYRGVMIMPVFEYFHNVAATRSTYKDAVVLGFKTNVTF